MRFAVERLLLCGSLHLESGGVPLPQRGAGERRGRGAHQKWPQSVHDHLLLRVVSTLWHLYSFQKRTARENHRKVSPYLFANAQGEPVHPDTFTKRLRKIFRELGFPSSFHLHTLRHYFVSAMLHEGVDKQTVAELAGHGDTSFLERTYCHPQMKLKQEAAEKLEEALFRF